MIRRSLYKEYDAGKAAVKIKALEEKLLSGGQERAAGKILDELYSIAFFAIKKEQTAILLQAAELLKLAYGQKYYRADEDVYWREVCLAAFGKSNFQAVEYFLEGAKLLFKNMPEKQPVFVALFKMAGAMAMREGKFFISARIINIFLSRLPGLSGEECATIAAVIDCTENIGAETIKAGDEEFFREICVLLAKNMQMVNKEQAARWDKLIALWLRLILAGGNKANINTFIILLSAYGGIRATLSEWDEFYALLTGIAGRFFGKIDDGLLKYLFEQLVFSGLNRGTKPVTALRSLETVFKAAVISLGWRRAVYIFTCWFTVCLRFLAQKGVLDARQAARREFLSESSRAFAETAVFAARMENISVPGLLLDWRQSLLEKKRSAGARQRTQFLFSVITGEWGKNYPLQAEKEKELLRRLTIRLCPS